MVRAHPTPSHASEHGFLSPRGHEQTFGGEGQTRSRLRGRALKTPPRDRPFLHELALHSCTRWATTRPSVLLRGAVREFYFLSRCCPARSSWPAVDPRGAPKRMPSPRENLEIVVGHVQVATTASSWAARVTPYEESAARGEKLHECPGGQRHALAPYRQSGQTAFRPDRGRHARSSGFPRRKLVAMVAK